MEVRVAKTAGFCFGVKRAVEKVYRSIDTGRNIYTYGPIIHNESVVDDLAEKGVKIIEPGTAPLPDENGLVVIRSHGVSRSVYEDIRSWGMEVVDATCPFVLKIHRIVQEASENGHPVIIVGNDGHPEVEGIKGWCVENSATVISDAEAAEAYRIPEGFFVSPAGGPDDRPEICVVAQTTFNSNKFKDILEILSKKEYNINAVNTICSATRERQQEAGQLARDVEATSGIMIVIGSGASSNSRKLYEICSSECSNTHFIQTLADLNLDLTKSIPCVGITAGASTPDNIIEEVSDYVRSNGRKF